MSARNQRLISMIHSLYKNDLCPSQYQALTFRNAHRWKLRVRPYTCANVNDTENAGAVAQYVIPD